MPLVGTQQSPIRIETAKAIRVPSNYPNLTFNYSGSHSGTFKGNNFVFDFVPLTRLETSADIAGKTLTFGSETWVIRKIHIHNPAEHIFDEDDLLPVECHPIQPSTAHRLVVRPTHNSQGFHSDLPAFCRRSKR